MADSTSQRNESFRYSRDQARRIQDALGASDDTDWKSVHSELTLVAQTAIRLAQDDPVPYAGDAAKQIASIANTLKTAAACYQALGLDQRATIESQHDISLEEDPLLLHSLLTTERPAVKKLLQGERLVMLLSAVARSAERVVAQLQTTGKAVPLSAPLPEKLSGMTAGAWKQVQETVHIAVNKKRQPFGNRFPAIGAPKEVAVRWAVPRLWSIFQSVTGQPPKVYPTSYDKTGGGYGGKFYDFAEAVLIPLGVIDSRKLANAIFTAYDEHRRRLLPEPPIQRRPRNRRSRRS